MSVLCVWIVGSLSRVFSYYFLKLLNAMTSYCNIFYLVLGGIELTYLGLEIEFVDISHRVGNT